MIFNFIFYHSVLLIVSLAQLTHGESTSPYTGIDVQRSHHQFLHLYRKYKQACSIRENNLVMPRYDGYNVDKDPYLPWTMNVGAVHQFFNLHPHEEHVKYKEDIPACKSVDDVTKTMTHSLTKQTCLMPWFSGADICHLLSQFSAIVFEGDSLTRHVTQTLHMLLREDLRYGSIPFNATDNVFDHCGCDGQYSEALLCREALMPTNHITDFRHYGACSASHNIYSNSNISFHFADSDHMDVYYPVTCDNSTKPYFFVLQGGLHYMTNIQGTWDYLIYPVFERINREYAACKDRIIVMYVGSVVVDEAVEVKYPHQMKANLRYFHQEMKERLAKDHPETIFMDYYTISEEAVKRTSDGCHSMTDINVVKTVSILNVLHHALNEYNIKNHIPSFSYHNESRRH